MSSRAKLIREQIEELKTEFATRGVTNWYWENTQRNHVKLIFYCGGKPLMVVFAPSTERRCSRNIVTQVRRLIRDADNRRSAN